MTTKIKVARETNEELRAMKADTAEGFDVGAVLSIARRSTVNLGLISSEVISYDGNSTSFVKLQAVIKRIRWDACRSITLAISPAESISCRGDLAEIRCCMK